MSLLVWFPLNGNVNNQGASILTMSSASAGSTLTNTGKVTKQCYGNTSYETGGFVSAEKITLGQNQSIFAWVKFTSLTSNSSLGASIAGQHRYPTNAGMGMTIKYITSTTGYLSVNTGNGSSRTFNTYCGSTLLQANTWYHLGYTYDGSTIRLYVNGVLDGSHAYTGMVTPSDYFMVGCWSFSGSSGNAVYPNYKLNGYINDVRAYNHTLSLKEIKELSKGLCLHYKFNFEDLYQPIEYIEFTGSQYIDSGVKALTATNFSIEIDYQRTNIDNADACLFGQRQFGKFTNMYNTYYESAYGNTASGTANDYNRNVVLMNNTGIYKNGTALISGTISSISSNYSALIGAFSEDSGANAKWFYKGKMYHLKIVDNRQTIRDYIPCVRKTDSAVGLYDVVNNVFYTNAGSGTFSYPSTTIAQAIPDDSGYGNTGTLSGTIVASTDTPVGNASAYLNNVWCKAGAQPPLYMPQMSVFMWIKQPTPTTQIFLFGTFNNWMGNGIGWWADGGGQNMSNLFRVVEASFYTNGTVFTGVCDGNWHHIGITWDGSNYKTYKDGALLGTVTATSGQIYNPDYIFGGSNRNNEKMQGYMADARLYATALTQADVTELYKCKESIDKQGNLYCNDYNEFGAKIDFSKKSVVKSGLLSEGLNKVALQSSYTQLEYLQSSGTQYIDTGVNFNLNTGWYEVKAQATTASQNGFILGDWTVSNNYYWLYHYQSGSTIRMYATNSGGSQVNFTTGLTSSNTNANTYFYKDKVMYVNGIEQSNQLSTTFSNPSGNCWLFKASGSNASGYPYQGRIFYAKLWQSGQLVRYFVPVKRNRDSVLGMLDLVNNVFYTNAGTGTFVAGGELGTIKAIYSNKLMEV